MADDLCILTQSHSHDFKKNTNLQFTSYIMIIILHDLSFLCSFIVSYPLYSSYFIFFSPYLIRIISFISPLFIAAVFLSLLLTTTTTAFCPNLPQLELEILQIAINELKSNLNDVNGDGEECDFEIFNFVFDSTQPITIDYEGVDRFEEERRNVSMEEKVLEDSVHGGRRNESNEITRSELEMDDFEENCLVKLIPRPPEKNRFMKENVLEASVHGGRRNDVTNTDVVMDEFEEKNDLVKLISRRPEIKLSMKETILEDSVHGGRRNDVTNSDVVMDEFEEKNDLAKLTSRRPEKKLWMKETVLEASVHGGRRNDVTTIELDIDNFEEKNPVKLISRWPEKNLFVKETIPDHGSRKNDLTTNDLQNDKFEEKNDLVKLISRRPEKKLSMKETILEDSVHGGRRNDLTTSDLENDKLKEENDLVKLFEELDRFESIETGTDSDKVIEEFRKAEPTPAKKFRTGSKAIDSNDDDNNNNKITQNSAIKVDKSSSWRSNSSSSTINGSMKEDKEWRRTLACKLFEERHNSQGGEEGMDSLWEAYETDNSKKNKKDAMIITNNGGIKCFDEEDDEDMGNGQLCCLQALKLSTGKMNLGMKKPNLLKISKALKGFGWLHHIKIKNEDPEQEEAKMPDLDTVELEEIAQDDCLTRKCGRCFLPTNHLLNNLNY